MIFAINKNIFVIRRAHTPLSQPIDITYLCRLKELESAYSERDTGFIGYPKSNSSKLPKEL